MLTAPGTTVLRARSLRRTLSAPEARLWIALRERPGGLKFRKQHPAGPYVLDFFCAAAALCVEVDGAAHDRGDQPSFDARRDAWLLLHGISTLRISNDDILRNLEGVVAHIVQAPRARLPLHRPAAGPPPRSGEEKETA